MKFVEYLKENNIEKLVKQHMSLQNRLNREKQMNKKVEIYSQINSLKKDNNLETNSSGYGDDFETVYTINGKKVAKVRGKLGKHTKATQNIILY